MTPKWIRFEEDTPPSWKTRYWRVLTVDSGAFLGGIKWWNRWRCYCFFPEIATIFEKQCLRDIAEFCQEQTEAHRLAGRHR